MPRPSRNDNKVLDSGSFPWVYLHVTALKWNVLLLSPAVTTPRLNSTVPFLLYVPFHDPSKFVLSIFYGLSRCVLGTSILTKESVILGLLHCHLEPWFRNVNHAHRWIARLLISQLVMRRIGAGLGKKNTFDLWYSLKLKVVSRTSGLCIYLFLLCLTYLTNTIAVTYLFILK